MSDRGKNWNADYNDSWDGEERRSHDDRRHYQAPPPYYQPYYPPPTQPTSGGDAKNVAQTTLTLQQIGAIIIVLGSVLFSGFNIWTNLNKDIDLQKNTLSQFKEYMTKDMTTITENMKELKQAIEQMKEDNEKTKTLLNQRVQELDSSFTQLYQKVNK